MFISSVSLCNSYQSKRLLCDEKKLVINIKKDVILKKKVNC